VTEKKRKKEKKKIDKKKKKKQKKSLTISKMSSEWSPRSPRSPRTSAQRRKSARTKKQTWGEWAYKWRAALGLSAAALLAATYYYHYGTTPYGDLYAYAKQRGVTMTRQAAADGKAALAPGLRVTSPLQDGTIPGVVGDYVLDGTAYGANKYRQVGTARPFVLYRSPKHAYWSFTAHPEGVATLKGTVMSTTTAPSPAGLHFLYYVDKKWKAATPFQVVPLA
jgi:hypothetical protein